MEAAVIAFWAGVTIGAVIGLVLGGLISSARHADVQAELGRLRKLKR